MSNKRHMRWAPAEWLMFLRADAPQFDKTTTLLVDLIDSTITKHIKDPTAQTKLSAFLTHLIPIAAMRYQEHFSDTTIYTFPTYFSWYIAEVINTFNPVSTAVESVVLGPQWSVWNRQYQTEKKIPTFR